MLEERHPPEGLVIRTANDHDLEWVVRRHGEIYLVEKGWDERFRALVEGLEGFEQQLRVYKERPKVSRLI